MPVARQVEAQSNRVVTIRSDELQPKTQPKRLTSFFRVHVEIDARFLRIRDRAKPCRELARQSSQSWGERLALGATARLLSCELKRKKPARQKQEDFHHNVYVVLLSHAVAKHPSILRLNPKRDPMKPCVYVGMTGIPVDHRFKNHKSGYKSAWVVRKYGVRLMPELYKHLNPMPFEAAVQMEAELAEDLRAAGYTVTGGH